MIIRLLVLLAIGLPLVAANNIPADVRAALHQPATFQLKSAVADIPAPVRAAFAKATHEDPFAMAEPGAAWQVTDVVHNPRLPHRRLFKVAFSKSYCILFYEKGGIARVNCVVVLRLAPDGPKLAWAANSPQPIADVAGLLTAIDKGQVDQSTYF